jgi:SAM-dependent methyltransferase
MDVRTHNRDAWDREVERGNCWTRPVGPEVIADARAGRWSIVLTPKRPVPLEWFPPLEGAKFLCLASGGGQQGPILAAAGAEVTVLDNSPAQLGQDRLVAEREGLTIRAEEGDMADLYMFEDEQFDLIVHPVSNNFVADVLPVWREAHRVLRPGGALLAGFMNPAIYLFDHEKAEASGTLEVRYKLPYSDTSHPDEEKRAHLLQSGNPLEHSHTLDDQIGGQLLAGFKLAGFYEDSWPPGPEDLLEAYMHTCMATRAVKPTD